jgi:glucose-6-phosphate 1-dehydrogenase
MPALFQAFRHGKLPARTAASSRWRATSQRRRSTAHWLQERFQEVEAPSAPASEEFARFAAAALPRMDLSQPETTPAAGRQPLEAAAPTPW